MIEKEEILKQLKKIIDPEMGINIVDLGLIYKIEIVEKTKTVKIEMTLTCLGCPMAGGFEEEVKEKLMKLKEIKNVKIKIVWEPAWDMDRMSEKARKKLGF